ncbi:MAG: MerR family transcriptional regulator [Clostridiales bacterium]|nr:MerR family transcriptional regulator [Clostridiales bacterium]
MMTIKDFAALCGCNAQTLRYYDRIGLLCPARVDQWSGYRYYNDRQAVDFVKIKNLQLAEFTIEEIKDLLRKTDKEVYDAFDDKIRQQREKLSRILEIQKTYLKEKTMMEKMVEKLSDFLLSMLEDKDMLAEFGLGPEEGEQVVSEIRSYLTQWATQSIMDEENVMLTVNQEVFTGPESIMEKLDSMNREKLAEINVDNMGLVDRAFMEKQDDSARETVVWEKHGWNHVYEFIDELPKVEDGREYSYLFQLNENLYSENVSFPMYMLGTVLHRRKASNVALRSDAEKSTDGLNHFWLKVKE